APHFAYRAPDDPVTVSFDTSTPLVLILNEVLSNAIKHAFPNGPGEVVITVKRSRGRIVLRVRDNGVGLPPDHRNRMRDSMGLRLIAALAKQIGGRARFTLDRGTMFTLSLPQSVLDNAMQPFGDQR